ncbi:MAG: NYN domain-containing protein [Ruminococcus sp.]|jgi:uncharacterized protein YutE (UPF0331/DUF86 family)|nr:NYN domain-containing protein [Ruminococcus sp.]
MNRVLTKDIVGKVGYLIGVKKFFLEQDFRSDGVPLPFLAEFDETPATRIIRSLCKLRNMFILRYKTLDSMLTYELKNLKDLDFISQEDVEGLEKMGVDIVKYNYRAAEYIKEFNTLINAKIDDVKGYFPDFVEWRLIRNLFIMPNGDKPETFKSQYHKFACNKEQYPYKMYINWHAEDCGNLLANDAKFLQILYRQNGMQFHQTSQVSDAARDVKTSIYSFIESARKCVVVVDCENADLYKLYAVLKNLNPDEISRIEKILLYDDPNTIDAWHILEDFLDVPVEYNEIVRVLDHKSIVDAAIITGVSREHYAEHTDSFILVSSDSDYWVLIQSLSEARFLVMIEEDKCSHAIKEHMQEFSVPYCSIDEFYSGNISDLKTAALIGELKVCTEEYIELNARQLLEDIYWNCHITATEIEKQKFYEKYIKSLKLDIDPDGKMRLIITAPLPFQNHIEAGDISERLAVSK